jgi:hypothetical protein
MTWTAYKTFSLDRRAHNTLFNHSTLFLSAFYSVFEGGCWFFSQPVTRCHLSSLCTSVSKQDSFPPHFISFSIFFFISLSLLFPLRLGECTPVAGNQYTASKQMQIYIPKLGARSVQIFFLAVLSTV